jgi:hypothetical protein
LNVRSQTEVSQAPGDDESQPLSPDSSDTSAIFIPAIRRHARIGRRSLLKACGGWRAPRLPPSWSSDCAPSSSQSPPPSAFKMDPPAHSRPPRRAPEFLRYMHIGAGLPTPLSLQTPIRAGANESSRAAESLSRSKQTRAGDHRLRAARRPRRCRRHAAACWTRRRAATLRTLARRSRHAARRRDHRLERLPALLSVLRRREVRLARRIAEDIARRGH